MPKICMGAVGVDFVAWKDKCVRQLVSRTHHEKISQVCVFGEDKAR